MTKIGYRCLRFLHSLYEIIRVRLHIGQKMDLQLFADQGDKTEKATAKKRQDARKKGQVVKSRDVTSAMILVFIFVGLRVFGGYITDEISIFTKRILTTYFTAQDLFNFNALSGLFYDVVIVLLKTVAPVFAVALITGLIVEYAQVGVLFTMETLGFKFERLNPLSGIKRIFSLKGLVELLKATIKIVVAGYIAYSYLASEAGNVLNLINADVIGVGIYVISTAINVAIRICIVLIILGILDYAYQWWENEKSLKMSKQEVKDEYKQTEGNPEIKSKIRQRQKQMSMRRMMQEVPKADVVITNPTHFAVALKYDAKISDAPILLAKGQDFIALRIKETARENKVEVVENKKLARSIYETVEIGQSIPQELFQAVAEVLAFVYSLKQKGRAG